MSEFKAQILGILIVLTLFVTVGSVSRNLFNDTWDKVENVATNKINEIVGNSELLPEE